MPGVLIVEAMAQVAGVLVLKSIPDRKNKLVPPRSAQQANRRPVWPGHQLRIEMKVTKRKASIAKMHGQATVDDLVVAEAELMCKLVDRQPPLTASADEGEAGGETSPTEQGRPWRFHPTCNRRRWARIADSVRSTLPSSALRGRRRSYALPHGSRLHGGRD